MNGLKGMLIKDFKFLKNQKQFFGVVMGICIIFLISLENVSFIIAYAVTMAASLTVTTVTYDEADKSMVYLLTMPISRKTYAAEKYIFGAIAILSSWLLTNVAAVAMFSVRGVEFELQEWIIENIIYIIIGFLLLAFQLPICLKCGPESGRVIFFTVIIVIVLGAVALLNSGIFEINSIIENVSSLTINVLVFAAIIITAVIIALSYAVSAKIMAKKQL